jgi:hypothetical protein
MGQLLRSSTVAMSENVRSLKFLSKAMSIYETTL